MNMLASLKNDPSVKIADEKDTVGGSGPIDTNVYPAKVGMAYTEKSQGGALGLFVTFILENKKELRAIFWMTSGDAKGNKTYYTKDGENFPLPGFSQANSLALVTTGKEIADLDTEEKVIKLYNYQTKSEVPTKVQVVTDLIGQDVILCVMKQTVDKTKETAPGSKVYEPTGETREENEVEKVLCAKDGFVGYTSTEVKSKAETAAFMESWVNKFAGTVRNKATGTAGTAGAPGKAGAAAGTAGTPKPKSSLFG